MNLKEVIKLLSERMNKPKIKLIVNWIYENNKNLNELYELSRKDEEKLSVNALWCMTHLKHVKEEWLQTKQQELIDRLLVENHVAKKRMLLQLLREQKYDADSLRTEFIDFCFKKINSEYEPYAIRCFCIYCAFKMCRFYPELVKELEGYLNILSMQNMSPGLKCALRTTRKEISKLHH